MYSFWQTEGWSNEKKEAEAGASTKVPKVPKEVSTYLGKEHLASVKIPNAQASEPLRYLDA